MYETIVFEKAGAIATLTLNRPKRLNAINGKMIEEIGNIMDDIAVDAGIKVVIITGSAGYFCAGADIGEIIDITEVDRGFEFSRKIQGALNKIENLPKPVIAAVSGLALGGGCEMALACDLRLAGETASFGVPEINIGIIPGAGGTQRLSRILGICKAKELLYTGDRIDAVQACQLGMINKVVPVPDLMKETGELAAKLATKPPLAIKMAKHVVNTGIDLDMDSALKLEAHALAYLFVTADKNEGMTAFLEKRKAKFAGR